MNMCVDACVSVDVRVCLCGRACVRVWGEGVCVGGGMWVLFVGRVGMMRCIVKKNEPLCLYIGFACSYVCMKERDRERETIESAGVDVGG